VILIEINGQKLEVSDEAILKDVLEISRASYLSGTTIGILKAGTTKEEATSEFKIITTKGEFRIELTGEHGLWTRSNHDFIDVRAHWETGNSIAFGPVETDVVPERVEKRFNRYDVFFGTGGYDPKNTYLMFSKDKHFSDYGSPRDAVIGKIISG
jgi:UPF0288 family protein (methanogenesis marker protein 3)